MVKASSIKPTSTTRGTSIRAAITAVQGYLPPDLLTNAELAEMVDTSDAWITERRHQDAISSGKGLAPRTWSPTLRGLF